MSTTLSNVVDVMGKLQISVALFLNQYKVSFVYKMSDLDNDLLALAGAGDSDGESVSGFSQSKTGVSNLPSDKKNDDDDDYENEDDNESQEEGYGDDLVNPYPLEGKYTDEEDRNRLLSMDEIQREQTLFEREQEMERYNERIYLSQRMNQQKGVSSEDHRPTRTSARTKTQGKSSKLDKLNELRKQREQKSEKGKKRSFEDREYEDNEEDRNAFQEENDDNFVEQDDDEYGYDEDEIVWGYGAGVGTKRRSTQAKLEDLNRIRLGRSLLHRYCFYDDFSDTVIGCFGKINLGLEKKTMRPMYRLVQVTDVQSDPERAYDLPGFKCDIYLKVSQNKEQQKSFPITVFSDSPIENEEFQRYLKELEKTSESLPYIEDVNEKYEMIQHLTNRGVTDKDVNSIIEKKRRLQSNIQAADAVIEKTKTVDELKVAKQENNVEKARQLVEKLNNLERILTSESSGFNTSLSLDSMSKVNERNRKLNQSNIRRYEAKSSQLKKSEFDGDLSSKLKENSRTFYEDVKKQENEKAMQDAKTNYDSIIAEKADNEAKISKSTYRCLGVMDKLIKNIDIDMHFDV